MNHQREIGKLSFKGKRKESIVKKSPTNESMAVSAPGNIGILSKSVVKFKKSQIKSMNVAPPGRESKALINRESKAIVNRESKLKQANDKTKRIKEFQDKTLDEILNEIEQKQE